MSFEPNAMGTLVAAQDLGDHSENAMVPFKSSVIKFAPKCRNESCESSSETNDCCDFNNGSESLKRKNVFENNGPGKMPAYHSARKEEPSRGVHFCSRCGYAFSEGTSLKHHKCFFTPTSPCIVCGVQVPQNLYGDHVISHVSGADKIEDKPEIDSDLKCAYCSKPFNNKTTLLVHYRNHIAQFQCTNCKTHFLSAVELKEHVETFHDRVEHQPYHCYICNRRFTHQEAIVNHMRLHTGEMPFTCKECGRSFNQMGNLQRHVNTHRGERPHRCLDCGCKFTDPATLRNHSRIHTGELPYVCDICGRGFSQVGNLKRHMAKHITNDALDRPFRCPECGQGFAHESTLRNHFRTHTGEQPYKCTFCSRAFSQIGNLKRHMAKHASIQDFLCGTCNRNFATSTDLVQHVCVSSEVTAVNSDSQLDCCVVTPWPNSHNYPMSSPESSSRSGFRVSESSSCDTDLSDAGQSKSSDYFTGSTSEDEGSSSSASVSRKWRIFPCRICGKVYTWQHDLKIHFRIHSGEKPFQCDICHKRFAQSGAIRTHKKRHHPHMMGGSTTN